MKTLLAHSHPTYLRRLVRALNANRAGVYLDGSLLAKDFNPRLAGRAKLQTSCINGEALYVIRFPVALQTLSVFASQVTDETFIDGGSGRSIVASRQPQN